MKASERVLREEYEEAKEALRDDANPGLRFGAVATAMIAAARRGHRRRGVDGRTAVTPAIITRSAPSYAWAPETVRHLFRQARFADCPHGPAFRRAGDMVWVVAHDVGCSGGTTNTHYGALFVLGHHLEVASWLPVMPLPQAVFQGGRRVVSAESVADAIPSSLFDLARNLGVHEWVSQDHPNVGYSAYGYVLGLPVCAVAPYERRASVLAPSRMTT